MKTRNVAIFIFNEVEVLDFCGPFEVFSVAGRRQNLEPFNVYTVAETSSAILARNALSVNPKYTFADCPTPEVLVVPGGYGTRREMKNPEVLKWVKSCVEKAELILSICTGALILGKTGLLDGLVATTHHRAIEELRQSAPRTRIDTSRRFIDNGKVIVAAGVAAGIDASFHVVARLLGKEQALETATYIEYDWRPLP
ncbi:MAG: DJ-1/PfpI family protein [bacterium]